MGRRIDQIREMILELCEDKEWNWKGHIESVVYYSKLLAKRIKADVEIVEIAAWLHDIKKLKGIKEKHHIYGSNEAGEILHELGYPIDTIMRVKQCILTHSSDDNYIPKTKEEKVLAAADVMSYFDHIEDLFYSSYSTKKLSAAEGKATVLRKYNQEWKKICLLPEARKLAKKKYDAVMILLGQKA